MIGAQGGSSTFLIARQNQRCPCLHPSSACSASLSLRRRIAPSFPSRTSSPRKLPGNDVIKIHCCSRPSDPPAKVLRKILESPGIHQGPACFDSLSAKLVERAGFKFCFTSGIIAILNWKMNDLRCISFFKE